MSVRAARRALMGTLAVASAALSVMGVAVPPAAVASAAVGFHGQASAAAQPSPSPTPAPSEGPGAPAQDQTGFAASISADAPATTSGQLPYSLVVEATSKERQLTDVTVSMWITEEPLATSADLGSFLNQSSGAPAHLVVSTPVTTPASPTGVLPVGLETKTLLTAPSESFGFGEEPGVYGITVGIDAGGARMWTQVLPLTYAPGRIPTIDVAVLATIAGSPSRVEALLDAAADPRVALALDPTALGKNAVGDTQLRLLLDREVYLLPAQGLDVTSVAHASTPQVLTAALDRSRVVHDAPWLAIVAAADDTSLSLAQQQGAIAALADPRWSSSQADGAASAVTVDPGTSVPVPVLVPRADASAALAASGPKDTTASARLVASVAVAALNGTSSMVISPGTAWTVDPLRPGHAIQELFDASFVNPTSVQSMIDGAPSTSVDAPVHESRPDDAIESDLTAIAGVLTRLDALAKATSQPSAELDEARLALFRSAGVDLRSDAQARSLAIQEALSTARSLLDSVAVTSGSSLLLVSSSGDVPITVSNGLDVPVTVKVVLRSRSPILVTDGQPLVTIAPKSEATVTVPVTAVSSGDAGVSVALRTEDDTTLSVAESLEVSVHAAWGTTATGIFTVGLGLLLVGGIVRTVRRGRKDTRTGPSEEAVVAGGTSSGD